MGRHSFVSRAALNFAGRFLPILESLASCNELLHRPIRCASWVADCTSEGVAKSEPQSVIIDWIDLAFGAVPEQHVFRQTLPGKFAGRHQQPLEHRFERIEFLGAAPDAFLDLLR